MIEITHRTLDVNGIHMHLAEAGTGPLVLLLHGFPELWYSWRHQLPALAEAGFHAVAPDLRGYGGTSRPVSEADYSILHLVGDVVGLIDALGEEGAVLVGHDWGAQVAWHTTLLRPDLVTGVVGLSVPYQPRGAGGILGGGAGPPVAGIRSTIGDRFYIVYFQEEGVADAELGRAPLTTLLRFFCTAAGEVAGWQLVLPPGGGFLDTLAESPALPAWLTARDLDTYHREFARTGFTGGLNWYRNLDHNWALTAAWHRVPIQVPALFIVGDLDPTFTVPGGKEAIVALPSALPRLRDAVVLADCGHWTQQERPAAVNRALLGFLYETARTDVPIGTSGAGGR